MTVENVIGAAKRRTADGLLYAAAALALTFGLWVSLRYTQGIWTPNPDIFVMVELWRGFGRHGWPFLASWAYTQDNWLFSLMPIASALFKVFGTRGEVATLIGWLSFVGSVGLTSWVASRIRGPRAALALACVLIFAGIDALGGAGLLACPISHNISMTWALGALALAVLSLERGSPGLALLAATSVFIDAASDPWAQVGIAVPLSLAANVIAARNRRTRLGLSAAMLGLGSALAFVAARTRLFGILGFLPRSHFSLANWDGMAANLAWGYRSLGAIANIVPAATPQGEAARLISAAALVVLLGSAMIVAAAKLRREPPVRQLVLGVSLLSIAATAVLFVAGSFPPSVGVGRFLPNIYFLGGLLIADLAVDRWRDWPPAERLGVALYAALFAVSGIMSAPALWSHAAQAVDSGTEDTVALGAFLANQGLSYGYGPFWGAHASMSETLTGGRVVIRPVSFPAGRVRRRAAETAGLWYRPGAEPKGNRPFLLVRNDGEECADVNACVAAAPRQFGEPVERLAWRDLIVLVYPREIAGAIDP